MTGFHIIEKAENRQLSTSGEKASLLEVLLQQLSPDIWLANEAKAIEQAQQETLKEKGKALELAKQNGEAKQQIIIDKLKTQRTADALARSNMFSNARGYVNLALLTSATIGTIGTGGKYAYDWYQADRDAQAQQRENANTINEASAKVTADRIKAEGVKTIANEELARMMVMASIEANKRDPAAPILSIAEAEAKLNKIPSPTPAQTRGN